MEITELEKLNILGMIGSYPMKIDTEEWSMITKLIGNHSHNLQPSNPWNKTQLKRNTGIHIVGISISDLLENSKNMKASI